MTKHTTRKLTVKKVESLTRDHEGAGVKPRRYSDGGGLWIQIRDAEHRSWVFRYASPTEAPPKQSLKSDTGARQRWVGWSRWMGLGSVEDVSLARARELAAEKRALVASGVDPLNRRFEMEAAKLKDAEIPSFSDVAAMYIKAHEGGWRNEKHAAQWGSTLKAYVYPHFGETRVSAVTVTHIMEALEPIWAEKPETATRLRGRIESVLNYATARGFRTGENPARWRGHLQNLLKSRIKTQAVKHHNALPWKAIGAFMAALKIQEGIGARALQFTILTAARTSEVTGATWGEIDLKEKAWKVPAGRMKANREQRVPVSGAALEILMDMGRAGMEAGAFVFPGGKANKPLSNMAMAAVLKRMKRDDITVHGFRSTFRDWAAERTNYPREVAEAALAHTNRDRVEAAYRRSDLFEQRAALMAAWATFCGQAVADPVTNEETQTEAAR